MRFPKLLPLAFLLMVPSALAQLSGLSSFGRAMGGVFGGLFNGISNNPAIWMKVILIIIMFILMYVLVVPNLFGGKNTGRNKGSRTILSLAIAVAMVAPVPSSIIETLFTSLAFMGIVFYIAPVIGIMYLTYKMTGKDPKTNKRPEGRTPYGVALLLWIVTLFAYINGLGFAASVASIPNLELTAGIMNFVAIIEIIYFSIKLLSVSGKASVEEGHSDWFGKKPLGTPPVDFPPDGTDPGKSEKNKDAEKKAKETRKKEAIDAEFETVQEKSFWKPWTWGKSKDLKKTLGVVDDYLGRLKMVLEDLQTLLSRGKDGDNNATVKNNPNVQILLNDVTAVTAVLSRVDVVKKDSSLKTLLGQMEKVAAELSESINKGLSAEQTILLYKYFGRGGIGVTVYNRIAALFKKDLKQTQDEIMAQQILLKREEDRARQAAEAAKNYRSQGADIAARNSAPGTSTEGPRAYYASRQTVSLGDQLKAVRNVAYWLWRMGGMNPFTWNWNQPQQRSVDDLMASLVAITAKMKGSPKELLEDGRVYTLLSAILMSGISGAWLEQARQRADELYHVRTAADRGSAVPEVMLERVRVRIYQFAEAWTRRRESA